jgi:hypothetical protein
MRSLGDDYATDHHGGGKNDGRGPHSELGVLVHYGCSPSLRKSWIGESTDESSFMVIISASLFAGTQE